MLHIFILCLLSTVACTPSSTPPPETTVSYSALHNDTTSTSTFTTTSTSAAAHQQARKSARNFQPSLSTSTTSHPFDTAKKKLSYSPPDFHSLYSGNQAFVYNTFTDKGKYSVYAPPAAAPADSVNKQAKLSAKYSSLTGSLPTTAKIDRSQEGRDAILPDFYTHSASNAASNSRHGYGHYEEHGDYGGISDDEEYDGGHHFGPELYSHHHHHGHHHHHPIHYPPPAIYYPAHTHEKEEYSKLGVLAIVKIVLAKLKALGIFKVILLLLAKIPLIFLKIAIKFFFLFKAVKLFKLLTISTLFPLILIPLIPLLLLPLLLLPLALPLLLLVGLPLLLPLLMLIPVPVFGPPPTARTVEKKTSRRRRRGIDAATGTVWKQLDASHDFLALTQRVLESQQCLERLACKMAAKQDSATYTNVILWLLEKFRALAPSRIRDRLGSYIEAYKSGAKRPKTCKEKYTCDKPKFMMAHADTYYNLL